MPEMTLVASINHTLDLALSRDADVILLGEDVGLNGGVFRVTDGLQAKHGKHRVVDTPLDESGIMGSAIGLAIAGMKSHPRDPVRRLPRTRLRPVRQPRRPHAHPHPRRRHRPHDRPRPRRRRHPRPGTPLRLARSHLRPLPRPQGRHALDPLRRQGPAPQPPSTTPTPSSSSSPSASTAPSSEEVPEDYYTIEIGKAKIVSEGDGPHRRHLGRPRVPVPGRDGRTARRCLRRTDRPPLDLPLGCRHGHRSSSPSARPAAASSSTRPP
jgi:pyruvate dehydrogenase E1 component beta subunit